jgi:hypothetical protein
LPSFSGEKISLQVTVLLSITVFLLLVQDKLPSSSEHFPSLAIYFANSMALVCVSCVFSSVVLYLYYLSPDEHHISRRIRRLFFEKISKLLCVKLRTVNIDTKMDQCDHAETRMLQSTSTDTRKVPSQMQHEQNILEQTEWRDFSRILNRLFMYVYFCMALANTLLFICQIAMNYHGPFIKMG